MEILKCPECGKEEVGKEGLLTSQETLDSHLWLRHGIAQGLFANIEDGASEKKG